MTAPDLAAALLKDVPRYDHYEDGYVGTFKGRWMQADEVLAALSRALDPAIAEQAGEVLEGVTPGPWVHDGEPWNLIVWDGNGNRVCFMAHSNGLDDARDVATARFIAWARNNVPALLAQNAALRAERDTVLGMYMRSSEEGFRQKARAETAETALAAMTKERDHLAKANHQQAACLHYTAAELGPDCAATVEGLPKAARHAIAAERAKVAKLVEAAEGLSAILDKNETKGPLPDTALMLCWLAAQNVRAVLRGYMLEKTE